MKKTMSGVVAGMVMGMAILLSSTLHATVCGDPNLYKPPLPTAPCEAAASPIYATCYQNLFKAEDQAELALKTNNDKAECMASWGSAGKQFQSCFNKAIELCVPLMCEKQDKALADICNLIKSNPNDFATLPANVQSRLKYYSGCK